jgi:hypothetical protein
MKDGKSVLIPIHGESQKSVVRNDPVTLTKSSEEKEILNVITVIKARASGEEDQVHDQK